ncbi:AP-3 complex subunit sigma-like isoform X2 [Diospyros lotus]|uniref:AP-3 complex subunit sigma-like isoform X2 n=1 Tax=Diospyros lotus TaxID=55363 RepID=UPI0022518125|nr:AP-3 complex subunit sigma-like isoform X2 [Diospyros lotus]
MIRAVMVMNTLGKLRLARFYDFQPAQNQQQIVRSVYSVLCRRPENVSSFIQVESIFGPDTRLVYKHYATLYVVFVFDSSENELAMLDLIQVFVETLDKSFKNVCELDIVFSYNKAHAILDEIVFGGQVLETNSTEVLNAVGEISKLETASKGITLFPKSVSWLGDLILL